MSIQKFDHANDLLKSLLWQHCKAKNLQSLLQKKQEWYETNHTIFWKNWQRDVFDLRTANDFGLSVWSVILDLPLFDSNSVIAPSPGDYAAFGFDQFGLNFSNGNFATDATSVTGLPTEQKRRLLRLRYFQLITRAAIPEINRFLSDLFGPGNLYALDGLDMTMSYVYVGQEALALQSVIEQFDLLPRPAGVEVTSIQAAQQSFGFGQFNQNFNDSNFSHSGFSENSETLIASTGPYSYFGLEVFTPANKAILASVYASIHTGNDVEITVQSYLSAENISFVYDGVDSDVLFSSSLFLGAGVYSFLGGSAALTRSAVVDYEVAEFLLSGRDVDLLSEKFTFAIAGGTGNDGEVDDTPILYDDDVIERRYLTTLTNNKGFGLCDVSRDGKYLAALVGVANSDATFEIYIYDLHLGKLVSGYPIPITNSNFYDSIYNFYRARRIQISPDNKSVAYCADFQADGYRSSIEVREITTGEVINASALPSFLANDLKWIGSNEIVMVKITALAGVTSYSKLYNITTNEHNDISFSSAERSRDYLDVAMDLNTIFYTTTVAGTARLYAVANTVGFPGLNIFQENRGENYLDFPSDQYLTPRLSRDGQYLAVLGTRSSSDPGSLHIFKNSSGRFSLVENILVYLSVASLDWNSDATKLAVGTFYRGITLFNFDGSSLSQDTSFDEPFINTESISFGGPKN